MKPGRKKSESDKTSSKKAVNKEPSDKKPESDESDIYKLTGDQTGSDKTGIDGVLALQIMTVGGCVLLLGYWVLHTFLHFI
jgi:hypothetical protein